MSASHSHELQQNTGILINVEAECSRSVHADFGISSGDGPPEKGEAAGARNTHGLDCERLAKPYASENITGTGARKDANAETALMLARNGLFVFPCSSGTDRTPLVKWKTESSAHPDKVAELWRGRPSALVGIDCGRSGLLVIDGDRHDAAIDGVANLEALFAKNGGLPPGTPVVRTPRDGVHYYFRAPSTKVGNSAGELGRNELGINGNTGIDTRGEGGFVFAPDTVLADGRSYTPADGSAELAEAIMFGTLPDAPGWLVDAFVNRKAKPLSQQAQEKVRAPKGAKTRSTENSADRSAKYIGAALEGECKAVVNAPAGTRNHALNKSAFKLAQLIGPHLSRRLVELQLLQAARDCGLPDDEAIKTIDSGITAGLEQPREIPETKASTRAKVKAKAAADASTGDWRDMLHTDERGRIWANVANVLVAMRNAPELAYAFAHDEMERQPMLVSKLPNTSAGATKFTGARPVKDADEVIVQEWLQLNGLPKIGVQTIGDAIRLRALEESYHPVHDYLNDLVWDGTPRIGTWLRDYLGVQGSPYADAVGRWFLISMVARIFKPGCKVDYMLILEGPQGAMKSSVCAVLGGEWFSDNLPDIREGKEVSQHLRGKWLTEIAELSAMSKSESSHLKSFVTRTVERYRPPYGRNEVTEPRQVVFIGSTNEHAYLKDTTGGRRFWPVKVGEIRIHALKADRDQLFAEAVHEFNKGASWWPDRDFEQEHIKPQQEARLDTDPWLEIIGEWIEVVKPDRIFIGKLAVDVLNMPTGRVARDTQSRLANILSSLGWQRSATKIMGYYPWFPAKTKDCDFETIFG